MLKTIKLYILLAFRTNDNKVISDSSVRSRGTSNIDELDASREKSMKSKS